LHDLNITIGEFGTELKPLVQNITETALAIDDYQHGICNNLSNPNIANYLTPDSRARHTENLFSAHACILLYRSAFNAFMADQNGQRENLDASFKILKNFVQSVVDQSTPTKPNAEERRKKAISEVLSSIGIEGKDQDRTQLFAIVSKPRIYVSKRENLEDQIRNETASLHARLMQIITRRNLNSQLSSGVGASGDSSRIDGSSISEMVDLLIRNGVLTHVDERARGFMEELKRVCDRVANEERISLEELDKSDYGLAVPWLEMRLDDIEERERQQQM
jgi:polyhydroxyalkanoate synthesis regulator phasin